MLNREKLQRLDNYYYIGKKCRFEDEELDKKNKGLLNAHALPHELNSEKNVERSIVQSFKSVVAEHYKAGHNVILSSESFSKRNKTYWPSDKSTKILKDILEGWEIIIVVSYRRLEEFIATLYPIPFDPESWDKLSVRDDWPVKGEEDDAVEDFARIPTISQYIESILVEHSPTRSGLAKGDWMNFHPSVRAFRMYKKHFDNVLLINMHNAQDYFTDLICNILPSAPHLCKMLLLNNYDGVHVNKKSYNSHRNYNDADRLVTLAYDKGLIKDISRANAKDKVFSVFEDSDSDLKTLVRQSTEICPPNHLFTRLMNITLLIEKYMCHEWFNTEEGVESRRKLEQQLLDQKSEKRKKYCQTDVEEVVEKVNWDQLLKAST